MSENEKEGRGKKEERKQPQQQQQQREREKESKPQLLTFADVGFLKHVFQQVVDLLECGPIFGVPLPACNTHKVSYHHLLPPLHSHCNIQHQQISTCQKRCGQASRFYSSYSLSALLWEASWIHSRSSLQAWFWGASRVHLSIPGLPCYYGLGEPAEFTSSIQVFPATMVWGSQQSSFHHSKYSLPLWFGVPAEFISSFKVFPTTMVWGASRVHFIIPGLPYHKFWGSQQSSFHHSRSSLPLWFWGASRVHFIIPGLPSQH